MNIDKQIKIGSDLYVVVTEPYEIETDADRIFIPEDSFDEFLLINETLEDKLYKYNYNVYAVSNSPIRKYLTDLEYQYFTVVALGNGDIAITMPANLKTTMLDYLSYSVNGGEWVTITNTNSAVSHTISGITKGDRIFFKGVGIQLHANSGTFAQVDNNTLRIKPTFQFNLEGNIMSLLYGDNFRDQYVLVGERAFMRIFGKLNTLINAENLILPATTLNRMSYYQMFSESTNLLTAPKDLPAKVCPYGCYAAMFDSCTKLKTAPKIHGTWYGESSVYRFIFKCPVQTELSDINCTYAGSKAFYQAFEYTKIKKTPSIKCDEMEGESVFRECFSYGTEIEYAGDIQIGNATLYAFIWAYAYCGKLKKAPSLTVKRLDNSENFANMFNSCTSLEYPMKISDGLKLIDNSFIHCYKGCTSLKETMYLIDIEILGEDVLEGCYEGCTSLETVREIRSKNVGKETFKDYIKNTGRITRFEEICIGTIANATSSFENFMNGSQSVVTPFFKINEIGSGASSTFKSAFSGCSNITEGARYNINWNLNENDFTNAYSDCPNLHKVYLPTETTPSSGTCTTILANNTQDGKLYIKEGVTLPEDAAIPNNWTVETF